MRRVPGRKMKNRMMGIFSAALLLAAAGPGVSRAGMIDISGGISKNFNAEWSETMFSMNEHLSYDIKNSEYTMVEGKIANSRTGIALGVDADIDSNAVGKVNRLAGYIGLKRLYMRYQSGVIKGSIDWDGALAPGRTRTVDFEGVNTHVDLLYWRKKIPLYFGIGYTSNALPIEIKTTYTAGGLENQKKGVAFFDPDYKGQYYSFLFGFDSFTSSMLYQDSKEMSESEKYFAGAGGSAWGVYFIAQDRIGFGTDQISDQAMADARALNPGLTPVGNSFFSTYIENVSSIGLRWRGKTPFGKMAVGLGYELMFYMMIDPVGGGADKRGELGIMPDASITRQGPVVRLYMQW